MAHGRRERARRSPSAPRSSPIEGHRKLGARALREPARTPRAPRWARAVHVLRNAARVAAVDHRARAAGGGDRRRAPTASRRRAPVKSTSRTSARSGERDAPSLRTEERGRRRSRRRRAPSRRAPLAAGRRDLDREDAHRTSTRRRRPGRLGGGDASSSSLESNGGRRCRRCAAGDEPSVLGAAARSRARRGEVCDRVRGRGAGQLPSPSGELRRPATVGARMRRRRAVIAERSHAAWMLRAPWPTM